MAKRRPSTASSRSDGSREVKRELVSGDRPAFSTLPWPSNSVSRGQVVLICILLFLLVVWAFFPSLRNGFVDYDDDVYVTANTHVQSGLTLAGMVWSLGSTAGGNYWHPLTWLSHMLDCQIFGLRPWGHHLTSVLFHSANTVLLFVVLRRMTKATWRSLLVAALFGLHPLRVESVAWVAERKDVLSAFFGLLAIIFYVRYAEGRRQEAEGRMPQPATRNPQLAASPSPSAIRHPPSAIFCLLSLGFFTLGLMSKPMLVTLPFVLLLLDYWPLRRLQRLTPAQPSPLPPQPSTVWRLLVEKLPFFVFAAGTSVAASWVQKGAGVTAVGLPLGARAGNALVAYSRYLGKLIWPVKLAVLYPHPIYWPAETVALAVLLLLAVTVFVLALGRRHPYLRVGWFWFVGTLVPVIGLVQAGAQSMADRYTYLPMIGLLVMLVWGAHELTRQWRYRVIAWAGAAVAMTVCCLALTRQQIGYWKDTETLFRHALAVTRDNAIAHLKLGTTLSDQGRFEEAISELHEAIRLKPDDSDSHNNLGAALGRQGRLDEAIAPISGGPQAQTRRRRNPQ